MEKIKKLYAAIVVFLVGDPAAINQIFDEQTPACAVSAPDRVTAQSCDDKQPGMTHAPENEDPPTYRPVVGVTVTPGPVTYAKTIEATVTAAPQVYQDVQPKIFPAGF